MPHQICLEWNNHKTLLIELKRFLINESMIDVTIACDGKTLKAHKLILSACSPYFETMFEDNPCPHPIVILPNVKFEHLQAVIHFMYHGEVCVSDDQIEDIFKTAAMLKVKVLGDVLELNDTDGETENHSRSEAVASFVADSENQSGDAACVPSSENKLSFSLNTTEQTSVVQSADSRVNVEDPTLNTSEVITTSDEQQPTEENIEEDTTIENPPENHEEIPTEEIPTNIQAEHSSIQSNVNQHQESSSGTATVPYLRPSFVVLKDVMTQMPNLKFPEKEKIKYSKSIPQKEPKKKLSYSNIPDDCIPLSLKIQRAQMADSSDSTRKVLNKIDNNSLVKRYRCTRCPFKTPSRSSLKRHIMTRHDKIRRYKCDQCSYAAALKQHLDRHKADIHEKAELRYRCTLCPYKSSHSANLKRHFENIHEKLKPFKCDKCEFETYHKVSLSKHKIGIHDKTRPFLCNFCTYRCSGKDNLRRHIKLRHGLH